MRFPSMLRILRNAQRGARSTARSAYTPYTPYQPYTNPPPDDPLGVTARESQTVPLGVSVPFNGTVSNAPAGATLTYSWDFGEGATDIKGPDGLTPSCKYKTPGDKTVTLTVSYTDTNGNLVEAYNSVTIKVDPCLSLPGETEPPWLTEARTYVGRTHEDTNWAAVQELAKFLGYTDLKEGTSWCGAFAGGILEKRGLAAPKNPLGSQSYRTWGVPCEERVGAVVVFKSHVGFVSSPGMVLGGNQSDEVNIREYDWLKVGDPLFFRWPSECPCPDEADESDETDESGETSE